MYQTTATLAKPSSVPQIKMQEEALANWDNYMQAKQAKLLHQFHTESVEKVSDIFKNVRILVNGLTHPPASELKLLMAAHGGEFHMYQTSQTTHIIASNLPNVKIKHLGAVPIVKPQWITESIALNKLLDYRRYLLYTNQSRLQPALNFPIIDSSSNSTKTASDPEFLQEFYNNSRLHLISTLGAEYKQLVNQWRETSDFQFPARQNLPKTLEGCAIPPSVVMHIDMDCFFASVAMRNHPELQGEPLAITHAKNGVIQTDNTAAREQEFALYEANKVVDVKEKIDGQASMSEIASCNYEARKYGIKNGMFLGQAVKLCPHLKTLPYDFDGYKEVSHILYQTVSSYTLDIEAVSCDEMYVDVRPILLQANLSISQFASFLRQEIKSKTRCPCSTGFGSNRLQARLATKRAKPDGYFYLEPQEVADFVSTIPLSDLPGVGRATLVKLANLGYKTCGDLQEVDLKTVQSQLGMKLGEKIWGQAHGVDNKPLDFNHERKSVSAEVNYGIRFKTQQEFYEFLESLSKEVSKRLSDVHMRAKGLTLKLLVRAQGAPVETAKFLGHGVCDSITKSSPNNNLYTNYELIFKEAKSIYDKLNLDYQELRGVGIQLTKLEKPAAMSKAMSDFLKQPSVVQPKTPIKQPDLTNNKAMSDFLKQPSVAKLKTPIKQPVVTNKSGTKRSRTKGGRSGKKPNITLKKLFEKTPLKKPHEEEQIMQQLQSQIDLSVLNELPEELRREVMEDYGMKPKSPKKEAPQLEEDLRPKTPKKNVNPFLNQPTDRIKEGIRQWVKLPRPQRIDTKMLAHFLRHLAMNRNIELLQNLMNFLYRNFEKLQCHWHKTYFLIVDIMQQGMVSVYGKVLDVKMDFVCCQA